MAPLFRQKQQWLLVILRKVLSTYARTCRCCSVLGLTSIETTLVNIAFHRFQQTTPPFLACEKNHITHCRTVCTCILEFFVKYLLYVQIRNYAIFSLPMEV